MTIHPSNPIAFAWSMIMIALIFIVSVTTPYTLVFQLEGTTDYFSDFSDILFIIDIFVNFNLGYIDDYTNKVEMNRMKIGWKYLNGDFLLDFVSSVPLARISEFLNYGTSNLKILKLLKFIRFFRLVKVSKVFKGLNIILK